MQDICKQMGMKPMQVSYLASSMRKEGIKLPKKHTIGKLRSLIQEVKKDLKI